MSNYRTSAMQHFFVSYDNAFRIMHSRSMRCSVSLIFASSGTDCCNTRFRKCMCSLMCRTSAFTNNIVQTIEYSDVYNSSVLRMKWTHAIYTLL